MSYIECPNCKQKMIITALEMINLTREPVIAIYYYCPKCAYHEVKRFT